MYGKEEQTGVKLTSYTFEVSSSRDCFLNQFQACPPPPPHSRAFVGYLLFFDGKAANAPPGTTPKLHFPVNKQQVACL